MIASTLKTGAENIEPIRNNYIERYSLTIVEFAEFCYFKKNNSLLNWEFDEEIILRYIKMAEEMLNNLSKTPLIQESTGEKGEVVKFADISISCVVSGGVLQSVSSNFPRIACAVIDIDNLKSEGFNNETIKDTLFKAEKEYPFGVYS